MSSVLCLTVRFLDPVPQFHGRGDDGEPEWPPSPLRLFQALVAASATRWREGQFQDYARPALQWLEDVNASIITPHVAAESFGYRMYVPNNSGDLMTAAWARGDTETSMAKFRVEKDVRPTHLRGGDAVHYLFPLADGTCPHLDVLSAAARSITHLGWGVDMAAGDASVISEEEAAKLPGERWLPAEGPGGTSLKVPVKGTLNDLVRKHGEFLNRLSKDGFKPVGPLREFRVVGYRRATEPAERPFAAFALLRPDAEGKRAFNPVTRTKDVAGMMRSLVGENGDRLGLSADQVRTLVHGHADDQTPLRGELADRRFQFLPLPTINPALNRVESIRRVLVVGPPGQDRLLADLQRRLSGEFLSHNNEPLAMLTVLPRTDWVLKEYRDRAGTWSTVTPLVLPGHHKGNREKATALIEAAFGHARLPKPAELEWRSVGFRAGVDLAGRYLRPDHMNGSMYHVRVRFPHAIPGPLAVGAGRYRGFGLFASDR